MPFASLFGALRPRAWRWIGAAILILCLVLAVLRWGQARYDAGVAATDAKWKAAGERLKAQAQASAGRADRNEANRVEAFTDRLAATKEKIDEATAEGRSPLDAVFAPGGM